MKPSKNSAADASERLLKAFRRLRSKSVAEDVHKLRTSVRRLEVLLGDAGQASDSLLHSLKRLRKKAGKTRDLDVHLSMLRAMRSARLRDERDALVAHLEKSREKPAAALLKSVGKLHNEIEKTLPEVSLQADGVRFNSSDAASAEQHAKDRFLELTAEPARDEDHFHQIRIEAKRIRYELEASSVRAEADAIVEKLKAIQDGIGTWHDWLTLLEIARDRAKDPQNSPLVAYIDQHTKAQHETANRSIAEVREWMLRGESSAPKKRPGRVSSRALSKRRAG